MSLFLLVVVVFIHMSCHRGNMKIWTFSSNVQSDLSQIRIFIPVIMTPADATSCGTFNLSQCWSITIKQIPLGAFSHVLFTCFFIFPVCAQSVRDAKIRRKKYPGSTICLCLCVRSRGRSDDCGSLFFRKFSMWWWCGLMGRQRKVCLLGLLECLCATAPDTASCMLQMVPPQVGGCLGQWLHTELASFKEDVWEVLSSFFKCCTANP